ncbi:hypothetical protein J3E72DRAFT_289683, partial [Bipolaris maydis]|uniref:uncharacterized protein n=1 Tax=Cochliobolus heterostrophus TaxID=5016 RepID=UPI0024DB8562
MISGVSHCIGIGAGVCFSLSLFFTIRGMEGTGAMTCGGFRLWSFFVLVFWSLLLSSYTLDSNEAVFW